MKYNSQVVLAYFASERLPVPVMEHVFCPTRKWRFDFAWKDKKLALEVEGGVFTGGRHTRGAGFRNDIEKYNTAALMGWMVLRVMPENLCMLDTVKMIKEALTIQR